MLEMSVCNAKAAQNVALVLSKYLYSPGFSTKFVVDSSPKAMVTKNRGDLEVLRSGAQSMKMLRGNYLRRASSESNEFDVDCDELINSGDEKVDLSAKASPKKVRKELEFLRKSSEGSRESKMERYQNALDSSLREDNDDLDISDYSAKASSKKVRKELEFLRKSSEGRQSKMEKYQNALDSSLREDNDDLDISDYPDRGYCDGIKNKDFDALSEDDRMAVTAYRQLTTSESMTLFKLMKANLSIVDDDDDQDADTLLDYALDMIDEGKSVRDVVNEVSMEVLNISFGSLNSLSLLPTLSPARNDGYECL
jgi:hypothetical protein